MNLKHIIRNLTITLPILAMLVSCDNIDKEDRYIELDPISAKRVVLLEEFTGQDCTNCPDGHRIAAHMKEQYGDAFIPVSIHASQLSWSEAEYGEYGLGIPEGEIYYKANTSPALPAGVVDRNSGVINRSDWSARVRAELEKESPVAIELNPTIDAETNDINIDITVKPSKSMTCNLTVWILESGIVNYQYDNGKDDYNYVHNHVLRAVVSDVWGDKMSLSGGVFAYPKYSYSINANKKTYWNTSNLSVVAFLTDDTGVIQAVEAHLK